MSRITKITPIPGSGLDAESAASIFELMARFAGYGFNKSHAAAYAATSFRTAWLKTHHPEAFFASAMNLQADEVDKIAVFVSELKSREIVLWAPSINASRARFEPLRLKNRVKGRSFGLCYSFSAIRGVGQAAADAIELERRRNGAFQSIDDFSRRLNTSVNRTAMIALAKAGAFDCLDVDRSLALAQAQGKNSSGAAGQLSLLDAMNAAPVLSKDELSQDEVLDNEFNVLGHYMTQHPLEVLRSELFEENLRFSGSVLRDPKMRARRAHMPAIVLDCDVRKTGSGKTMAVLTLSDPDGTYEALAFDEKWFQIRHLARKKTRAIFTVSIDTRDEERRLFIEEACPVEGMAQAA